MKGKKIFDCDKINFPKIASVGVCVVSDEYPPMIVKPFTASEQDHLRCPVPGASPIMSVIQSAERKFFFQIKTDSCLASGW